MRSVFLVLITTVLLLGISALSQRPNADELVRPQAARQQTGVTQRPGPEAARTIPAENRQELEAMRADLTRMRTLLNQMRTNLAFVQTSDTPLKHQFDLNNEMWQVVLNDLERRVQRLEQSKPR